MEKYICPSCYPPKNVGHSLFPKASESFDSPDFPYYTPSERDARNQRRQRLYELGIDGEWELQLIKFGY